MSQPEPWLRGPVPGVPPLLMPAAHALLQSQQDVQRMADGLDAEQLWARPGGAASVGFHLVHLAGALDRLLTYARGEQLSQAQMAALRAEASPADPRPTADETLRVVDAAIERALEQLRATDQASLLDAREVGRQRLPSNVLGLLFHAAEHTQRHAGQVIATAQVVRADVE
jgi:uncharacterized damage-inducible protein DinB